MKHRDWDIHDYYKRLEPRFSNRLSANFGESSRVIIKQEDIDYELLEESYMIMAEIVSRYGEVYLPIFKRLDEEIKRFKEDKKLLDKAALLSSSSKSPSL